VEELEEYTDVAVVSMLLVVEEGKGESLFSFR